MSEPVRWAIPAVLLVSLVGTPMALWWERRRPSSFARCPEAALDRWRSLPAVVQAAHDQAVLNAAEAAENVANRTAPLYRS